MKIPEKKEPKKNKDVAQFMACLSKQLGNMRSNYSSPDFDAQFTGGLKYYSLVKDADFETMLELNNIVNYSLEQAILEWSVTHPSYIKGIYKLLASTYAHFYTVKYMQETNRKKRENLGLEP